MDNDKKLFLLDGYALIYRAYFAFIKNPRVNSKGLNTSAVFGFTNTLLEVIKKQKPSHIAVVFDTKHPTERHDEYPQYKANREAMPEGLSESLPYIFKLLEALNIQVLSKKGYEADDIIGTIAKCEEKKGFQVYMMTSDKDFAQLVSDNIFMYRPATKWEAASIWGVPEVLEKFQVYKINQVIDFLAMMGDSADNIPGIAGVGEKTAQKFLEQFGSIEGLYANTHQIKGKIKEKIESSKEIALLSKKLVTIITDVPIEFNLNELKIKNKNNQKVKQLFNELEFRNLSKKLFSNEKVHETLSSKKTSTPLEQTDLFSQIDNSNNFKEKFIYEHLLNQDDIYKLKLDIVEKAKFSIHIISENQGTSVDTILGFSLCCDSKTAFYIQNTKDNQLLIMELCENQDIQKIGYDIKKTAKLLLQLGIKINLNTLNDIRNEYEHELTTIDKRLKQITNDVMGDTPINLNSADDRSMLFYSRKVHNKDTWVRIFNIGHEMRGATRKVKMRSRMSKTAFAKNIRNNTEVVRKTTGYQCSACKGVGRVRFRLKNGELGRANRLCKPCNATVHFHACRQFPA